MVMIIYLMARELKNNFNLNFIEIGMNVQGEQHMFIKCLSYTLKL